MKKLYEDLYQTSVEKPFPGLNTHAYFLLREEGNVLFYNTSNQEDIAEMSKFGGITHQYLSHRHETGNSLVKIQSQFQSLLCCDEKEEPSISKVCNVDVVFERRIIHSKNIEVIPTSGHTEGGLCFFYSSPYGLSYLFTGDLLYQNNRQWNTILIDKDGANRDKLNESLSILRQLKPDVVLSSGSTGDISVVEVNERDWKNAIDKNITNI